MRLLGRLFGKNQPRVDASETVREWAPLHYPEGLRKPMPTPRGAVPLMDWPDEFRVADLFRCGLEAWLGFHAMRRDDCKSCTQCVQEKASLILEFYFTQVDPADYPEPNYIGAYWHACHTIRPDDVDRWEDHNGQPLRGSLAYADTLPAMKSLHSRYVDGRIRTRWGTVASAPQGTTFQDRGRW